MPGEAAAAGREPGPGGGEGQVQMDEVRVLGRVLLPAKALAGQ